MKKLTLAEKENEEEWEACCFPVANRLLPLQHIKCILNHPGYGKKTIFHGSYCFHYVAKYTDLHLTS